MNEFFSMGGYAIFVWSSFGISLLVLLLNVILPAMRRKQLLRDVRSHIKRNRIESCEQNVNNAFILSSC